MVRKKLEPLWEYETKFSVTKLVVITIQFISELMLLNSEKNNARTMIEIH